VLQASRSAILELQLRRYAVRVRRRTLSRVLHGLAQQAEAGQADLERAEQLRAAFQGAALKRALRGWHARAAYKARLGKFDAALLACISPPTSQTVARLLQRWRARALWSARNERLMCVVARCSC